MENDYDILGVPRGATADEINKAFRTLAHKHHPDKPTGNADMFKKISGARDRLLNRKGSAFYSEGFKNTRAAGAFWTDEAGHFDSDFWSKRMQDIMNEQADAFARQQEDMRRNTWARDNTKGGVMRQMTDLQREINEATRSLAKMAGEMEKLKRRYDDLPQ